MSRILLVGEAPIARDADRPGRWLHPDYCRSAERLRTLCQLSTGEYLNTFARTNLLHRAVTKKQPWSTREARTAAEAWWPLVEDYEKVVLLGRKVVDAFFSPSKEPMEESWYFLRNEGRVVFMPHPSGLNRWWNDDANVKRATEFLRAVVA